MRQWVTRNLLILLTVRRRSFPALRVSSGCGCSLKIAASVHSSKGILVILQTHLVFVGGVRVKILFLETSLIDQNACSTVQIHLNTYRFLVCIPCVVTCKTKYSVLFFGTTAEPTNLCHSSSQVKHKKYMWRVNWLINYLNGVYAN